MPATFNEWYKKQRRFDVKARDSSELVLGEEAEIFAEAMCITAHSIDSTGDRDDFDSLRVKRMLGSATHSFNLLWSAWDSMLAGRYGAAATHQRSVNETPDLLTALYLQADFADRMTGTGSDIKKARRIVRDAYASAGDPQAKSFIAEREKQLKPLQPFSHLTFKAMGMGLGITLHEGEKVGFLRAGGAPASQSLMGMARTLALDAVELAIVVAMVLGDDDLRSGLLKDLTQKTVVVIGDQLDRTQAIEGEIKKFFLWRSDEEPPDPDRVPEVEEVMR